MELHFTGLETVLVAGGAGGIGSAVVEQLLDLGCIVIVLDSDKERLGRLEEKSKHRGGNCLAYDFDLEDVERLEPFFISEIAPICRRIDALVCCAGIQQEQALFALDIQSWRKVYATNLESCFVLSKLVGRHMIEHHAEGAIVFISSIHSQVVSGMADYSSAKAALEMLSKELAYSLSKYRIRVNAIAPGSIDTPLIRKALNSEDMIGKAAARVPLGRLGRPEEVASLVLYLLSTEAAYITGARFAIDGGLSMRG
jgi:NAD(P)-dependent dehydrogenase (short-subunit alcohol dehydrogenase family)